jgi:hypothetical protein
MSKLTAEEIDREAERCWRAPKPDKSTAKPTLGGMFEAASYRGAFVALVAIAFAGLALFAATSCSAEPISIRSGGRNPTL